MNETMVLIDGHSILNRAFYGVPLFTNSKGLHTNAVYGFLNILFKIIDERKPDYMAVAFDLSAPTFRHKMYAAYKGTRRPMPEELREQVPVIKDLLAAMKIQCVELSGYEADDILGTMAKRGERAGLSVSLVSGDRDMLQLSSDKVTIRIPRTKKGVTEIESYNEKDVLRRYHVTPSQFVDVKALMGDTSDNIPGVFGIGEKGATQIIEDFGSIENAYAHIDEIKNARNREAFRKDYEQAVLSKKLAKIDTEAPVKVTLDHCRTQNVLTKEAFSMIKSLEFKSMYERFAPASDTGSCEQNFLTADKKEQADEVFRMAKEAGKAGLFVCRKDGEFSGVSLAFQNEDTWYIPVSGEADEAYLAKKIRDLVKERVFLTVFSIKDIEDILLADEKSLIFDLSVAAYLINPLKESYEYDDIASEYLDMELPSFAEIFPKEKIKKADADLKENLARWSCYHAFVLYRAKDKLIDRLKETEMLKLYRDIEHPLIFALYDMERTGIRVQKEKLKIYGERLSGAIETLQSDIYEDAGETFNINSPKQLGEILFVKLGLPNGKKTKTGYSTSADVLERLRDDYPIVKKILEYRQLSKLKSTYADGLAGYISEDGRIHGKFNQTVTATGRISSTEPNLQNIPVRMELGREIRKVFVPRDGYLFIDADYSQIELRILAHMSDDENLINAYRDSKDIHRSTASKVFNVPLEDVTDEQRRNAKAVNFGIVYGISSFGLSQDLSISRAQAQRYIEDYFTSYPKVKKFLDRAVKDAKEKGYAVTLFGRRRPVPELSSSNFTQRSFGERVAMNSPIQGTAADIMKKAATGVYRELCDRNMRAKIVLQVHDELLVETPPEEEEAVREILTRNMKGAANLKIELEVGMKAGRSWFEAH